MEELHAKEVRLPMLKGGVLCLGYAPGGRESRAEQPAAGKLAGGAGLGVKLFRFDQFRLSTMLNQKNEQVAGSLMVVVAFLESGEDSKACLSGVAGCGGFSVRYALS